MRIEENRDNSVALNALCTAIREQVNAGEYQLGEILIMDAMKQYPHAPEPHNLLGILLEKKNEHHLAMKHFRAAWALDPTYLPARYNLETYGTFYAKGKCAFDKSDCTKEASREYGLKYDADSIGHIVRRR